MLRASNSKVDLLKRSRVEMKNSGYIAISREKTEENRGGKNIENFRFTIKAHMVWSLQYYSW